MSCPYLLEIDENKRIIHCDKGVHMKYLDYFDTKREICCNSFTKCKTYLCRQLAKMGVQLPWSEYNAEKLLEIYQQKLEEVKMNEIIETNSGQDVSLELLEQQIINQCRIQAQSFAETGKLLKKIKDGKEYAARGYESFAKYMDEACGTIFPFKSTQAYKYIRVFENYGPRLEQYGTISLDILDMFKDMPAEEFEQIADENNLESMSVKDAEELRKQLDKANEQISFLQSTVEDKDGKLSSAEGRIKDLEEELDEADQVYSDIYDKNNSNLDEIRTLKKELEELKNRPVEVAVREPDPAEIDKLVKEALKDSEAKHTKELSNVKDGYEKKLKALSDKLDSEKSANDERVKALEEQLKNGNEADEALVEFKFYFAGMQDNLKNFIAVLSKIEDADKKAKFKGAAVKFLTMTLDELNKQEDADE